ncbi:MAG: DUF721 domain-containing protein [Holosporaceae bacterium]|jgi:hypothetical protein|nr:DUF721 domain-containing protein [Holosporaceae bacterium]
MARSQSPVAIAHIVKKIIRNVINRPDYAEIFSNWTAVVGNDTASMCVPHKVVNIGKDKVLVLKTIKGRGLEIQHEAYKILHMVNLFLKKKTFSRIKVIQTDKTKNTN